ncbi:unnamed protein product [Acanthoscelides obtectus]|uniref:Uncharacterized protein n=1 Tax=Acanthoscelides obtectus TaxID=200917 RepID=A0A9P0JNP8_ACAOB|nr:unnamed protein product [Acanthoscelides obtectus]CAK1673773.1 hypothetical protein AOBTE_LOCUS29433 [Acanthoscelides obtectus]
MLNTLSKSTVFMTSVTTFDASEAENKIPVHFSILSGCMRWTILLAEIYKITAKNLCSTIQTNICDYDTSSSVLQETCYHHHHHQKSADSYHGRDLKMCKNNRQMHAEKTYHEVNANEDPERDEEENKKNVGSDGSKDAHHISKNDQEIQTEYIFPSEKEIIASDDKSTSETRTDKEPPKQKEKHTKKKKSSRKERKHRKKEEPEIKEIYVDSTKKCVDSTEDSSANLTPEKVDVRGVEDDTDENRLLRHKDSFIIHRKKQKEVKDFLQQPKCIRLYRKSNPSIMSRGGSYPLRSCLKKETGFFPAKGNFRLGAPGKPLFVTNSSYCRYI